MHVFLTPLSLNSQCHASDYLNTQGRHENTTPAYQSSCVFPFSLTCFLVLSSKLVASALTRVELLSTCAPVSPPLINLSHRILSGTTNQPRSRYLSYNGKRASRTASQCLPSGAKLWLMTTLGCL